MVAYVKKIRAPEFAKRLNQACDDSPMVPAPNHGRLGWIVERLGRNYGAKVSHESVRRWMTGETKPRPDTLTNLAAILSVSVEWLSLGINPEISESERRRRSINANGAANIVAGFIALSGGNAALPDEDQTDVDLIAILGGRQIKLEAPFINIVSGKGKLLVSKSHAKHTVVAVAKVSPVEVLMFSITSDAIESVGEAKSTAIEVECSVRQGKLHIGDSVIHAIKAMDEISKLR